METSTELPEPKQRDFGFVTGLAVSIFPLLLSAYIVISISANALGSLIVVQILVFVFGNMVVHYYYSEVVKQPDKMKEFVFGEVIGWLTYLGIIVMVLFFMVTIAVATGPLQ
ncbi:MAG: hypothetical protein JRN15_08480 [Nitrososphaerota archaeon]|nr:hypothetical protein [Nitrososphaerota archaeon]